MSALDGSWTQARAHEVSPDVARYKIVLHRVKKTDWCHEAPYLGERHDEWVITPCYACGSIALRALDLYDLDGEFEQRVHYCMAHYNQVTRVLDEIIRRSKAEVFGDEFGSPLLEAY